MPDDRSNAFERLTLYVVSGTGNSWRAAAWLGEVARERGLAVSQRPADRAAFDAELQPGPEQLLGLAMPTHGFTAPWAMMKFAVRVPRAKGASAICLTTRASVKILGWVTPGVSGTAWLLIGLILALKGYRIFGFTGVDMPSNWVQVHPRLPERMVEAISARTRPRVERFAHRVLDGRRHLASWSNIWDLAWGLPLIPISLLYLVYGRIGFGKVFFANDDCNSCGLCARNCAEGGVIMWGGEKTGRPHWTWHCESCNRCMAYCPQQAIDVSHSWLVLMCAAAFLPMGEWLAAWGLTLVPAATFLAHPVTHIVLLLAWWWVAMIALGVGLHGMARVGWLNTALRWTSLTRLFGNYHEPQTRQKDLSPPQRKKRKQRQDA